MLSENPAFLCLGAEIASVSMSAHTTPIAQVDQAAAGLVYVYTDLSRVRQTL